MSKLTELVGNTVKDLVGSFLYYDRKEDEDLPLEDLEDAFKSGEINSTEIACIFLLELNERLEENGLIPENSNNVSNN